MAIKQKPIGIKEYYQNVRNTYILEKEKATLNIDKLTVSCNDKRTHLITFIHEFKVPLADYPEFQYNKYINGRLKAIAELLYKEKVDNVDNKALRLTLLTYATQQEEIYKLTKRLEVLDKILNITYKDYTKLLKSFYTQVQKELIINGNGYVFEGRIGWICYNRIVNNNFGRRVIDWAATRKRKQEILDAGGKLWNKDEAEWCEKNDIPYEGEDYRVYLNREATYEIALLNCTLKNCGHSRIKSADYRELSLRGKSNDEIREECDNNINKICNLGLDMGTKLYICLAANKTLYTKFIRNENQTSMHFRKIDR